MIDQQPVIVVDRQRYTEGFIDLKFLELTKFVFGVEPLLIELDLPRWWFYPPDDVVGMYDEGDIEFFDEIAKEKPGLEIDSVKEYMYSKEFAELVLRRFVEALNADAPRLIDKNMVKLIVLESGWEFTKCVNESFKKVFANATVCNPERERVSYPLNVSTKKLSVSKPARDALQRHGIYTVDELTEYSEANLLHISGIGKRTITHIKTDLAYYSLELQSA